MPNPILQTHIDSPSVRVRLSQSEGKYIMTISEKPWSFVLAGTLEDFEALAARITAAVHQQRIFDSNLHDR